MNLRKSKFIIAAFVGTTATITFIFTWQLHLSHKTSLHGHKPHKRSERPTEKNGRADDSEHYLFHPLLNECKFPLPNTYASDIVGWRISERMRQLKCPFEDKDLATMDSEGYMYVHPHFANWPNITSDVKCKVIFIEGGLQKNESVDSFMRFEEVATVEAPENTRFYANADAFYIRCHRNESKIFEKPFAGMRDFGREKNKIYLAKDVKSFDKFGRKLKAKTARSPPGRYSIDILAIDSTSRTMFMRHMPRTVELMDQLGYHVLYGYNKVGDNSMVNLEPILAGDIAEALVEPMNDTSGDINPQWILPTNKSLDPSMLPFLWKIMKEEFGCQTMFNDDIADVSRGIFHYPPEKFKGGFTSYPADHYYRAYYLAVYKNWSYGECKDGGQIQREYLDLWRRFAKKYQDICHFGFTFITSLTHEAGLTIETIDEDLRSSIENLQISGALDNSFSIIMGDHGNRVGMVKYMYTGRIEERMPLMAIRLPTRFRSLYPNEYRNFLTNKWKFTSNFDIHKTLLDIALMRFGKARKTVPASTGRGISLFDQISANRSCRDAYISENFCTCMEDRHNLTMPSVRKPSEKPKLAREKYIAAISDWLQTNELDACFSKNNITIDDNVKIMGINALVRHGLRSKENSTEVEIARKSVPKMDFLYHEFDARLSLPSGDLSHMLFRIEEEVAKNEFRVSFEPVVRSTPSFCSYLSAFEMCECIASLKQL